MKRVPNILSASRIVLAPVFVFLYLQDSFLWAVVAMVIFIAAAITDYLDGYYARRYNVTSSLGTFLDPLADKILTFAGFICIPFIDAAQFPWWMIGIIIFRDIFVTMLRIWSEQMGQTMQTRDSAKFKTLIQMVFLYAVLLTGVFVKSGGWIGEIGAAILGSGIPGWIFLIVVLITVYTGLEYIYINRRLFKSAL